MARLGRRLGAVGRSRSAAATSRPGPDERDPAVVAAEAAPPDPGHLAQRPELVEQPRLVARDPGRQHVPLEDRRRDRQPGQLVDDLGQPLERGRAAQRRRGAAADRRDALPVGQEPAPARPDRPARPRAAAGPAIGGGAGAGPPGRTTRARRRPAGTRRGGAMPAASSRSRASLDDADRQAPAARRLGRQERAVRPGPPGEQPVERAGGRAEERGRDADRRRDRRRRRDSGRRPRSRSSGPRRAIRVADGPAGGGQLVEPRPGGRRAALGPGGDLGRRQVAEPAQQVVDAVERSSPGGPRSSAWRLSSRSASASGSSSSRSSSWPSSSRSRSRSRVSAPARRSASGVSPSYM